VHKRSVMHQSVQIHKGVWRFAYTPYEPCEQRIQLADEIKREALREQWRALSAKLPDRPEITEEDIINEIKVFRSELHETT